MKNLPDEKGVSLSNCRWIGRECHAQSWLSSATSSKSSASLVVAGSFLEIEFIPNLSQASVAGLRLT